MAVTIAAALFAVVVVPTLPQNSDSAAAAPMKPKPKTSSGGTITVKVTNWREADLVELQPTESGSANWKKVLGTLKAGQWTWAKVPQGHALPRFSASTFLFQPNFTRGSPNRKPIFVAWRALALRRTPRYSSTIASRTCLARSALGCAHIYTGTPRAWRGC